MSNVTPINPRPLAKIASAECSAELWRRLTNAQQGWTEAVQELAEDPAARAGLVAVSDKLQRHIEPCGAKAIITTLAPLATLYGVGDKTDAEWRTFWGFYADALGSLPAEAVRAGVSEYVADSKSEFFPRPGPLKAICERHAIPLRMAANRAQKALQLAPPAPRPPIRDTRVVIDGLTNWMGGGNEPL